MAAYSTNYIWVDADMIFGDTASVEGLFTPYNSSTSKQKAFSNSFTVYVDKRPDRNKIIEYAKYVRASLFQTDTQQILKEYFGTWTLSGLNGPNKLYIRFPYKDNIKCIDRNNPASAIKTPAYTFAEWSADMHYIAISPPPKKYDYYYRWFWGIYITKVTIRGPKSWEYSGYYYFDFELIEVDVVSIYFKAKSVENESFYYAFTIVPSSSLSIFSCRYYVTTQVGYRWHLEEVKTIYPWELIDVEIAKILTCDQVNGNDGGYRRMPICLPAAPACRVHTNTIGCCPANPGFAQVSYEEEFFGFKDQWAICPKQGDANPIKIIVEFVSPSQPVLYLYADLDLVSVYINIYAYNFKNIFLDTEIGQSVSVIEEPSIITETQKIGGYALILNRYFEFADADDSKIFSVINTRKNFSLYVNFVFKASRIDEDQSEDLTYPFAVPVVILIPILRYSKRDGEQYYITTNYATTMNVSIRIPSGNVAAPPYVIYPGEIEKTVQISYTASGINQITILDIKKLILLGDLMPRPRVVLYCFIYNYFYEFFMERAKAYEVNSDLAKKWRSVASVFSTTMIYDLPLNIPFIPIPFVTSVATATATVGQPFVYTITADNAPTSFNAENLPEGLFVGSNNGLIVGTPIAIGTYTVTISATNRTGTGTLSLTLTVNGPLLPVITSGVTATATVGQIFIYSITANNTPTSFNATGLPAGVTVNIATGVISGTPTTASVSTITISASNAAGSASLTLILTVNAPVSPPNPAVTPVVTSVATASATVGQPFNYAITANNTPTSFDATGLPAGVTVNPSTGVISGIPTTPGVYTVTISASNGAGTGNQSIILTVNPIIPAITSASIVSGTAGISFDYPIVANNTPTRFNATGLPNGLTVNFSTGVISGTPITTGTYTVTISASNSSTTATGQLTIRIYGSGAGVGNFSFRELFIDFKLELLKNGQVHCFYDSGGSPCINSIEFTALDIAGNYHFNFDNYTFGFDYSSNVFEFKLTFETRDYTGSPSEMEVTIEPGNWSTRVVRSEGTYPFNSSHLFDDSPNGFFLKDIDQDSKTDKFLVLSLRHSIVKIPFTFYHYSDFAPAGNVVGQPVAVLSYVPFRNAYVKFSFNYQYAYRIEYEIRDGSGEIIHGPIFKKTLYSTESVEMKVTTDTFFPKKDIRMIKVFIKIFNRFYEYPYEEIYEEIETGNYVNPLFSLSATTPAQIKFYSNYSDPVLSVTPAFTRHGDTVYAFLQLYDYNDDEINVADYALFLSDTVKPKFIIVESNDWNLDVPGVTLTKITDYIYSFTIKVGGVFNDLNLDLQVDYESIL